MVEISVIITTYNRGALLKRALEAVVHQSLSQKVYEVLVVDDGSTDDTPKIVRDFMKKYKNIRYFRQEHKGLSAGRNLGISKARGKIVAFTDDDCIPDRAWLENLLKAFRKESNIVGVEGKVITDSPAPLFSSAPMNLKGKNFTGCNSAYKKAILKEIGGYDKRFFAIRDDSDIAFRVMSQGKIVFAPEAVVRHPPLKVSAFHYLKRLKLVQSDILLYKKHPILFEKYIGNPFFRHFLQSIFAWFVLLGMIFSVYFFIPILIVTLILFLFLFRYIASIKGKVYSFSEALIFTLILFLRDLMYPFVFLYYWIKIKP